MATTTVDTLRAAGDVVGLYMGSQFKHDYVVEGASDYDETYAALHRKQCTSWDTGCISSTRPFFLVIDLVPTS